MITSRLKYHRPSRAVALLLAVVAGGALGDLADRLFRSPGPGRGAVIDWIHIAGYPATFNVAAMIGAQGRVRRWLSMHRNA